jgi:DNA helicase II / ATP-dependent DNA helicase PcrA
MNRPNMQIELDDERKKILKIDGHILIIGGPGSGKTTIALLRANQEIDSGILKPKQKVLFLSFARATVARVNEVVAKVLSKADQRNLEVETYHGFAWNIIKSHGYLLNNKPVRLLTPPEASSRLVDFDTREKKEEEKIRLFNEEGLLHFDLFAKKAHELISRSKSLLRVISDTYPLIILDEFQDTNPNEWLMIQELGKQSRLIALADAEQRIYSFRGADPKRISEFITLFSPTKFDFGSENNRSKGQDIVEFGNDILTGANMTKMYRNVEIVYYGAMIKGTVHSDLKIAVLKSLVNARAEDKSQWSIAILAPTNKLMLEISDFLNQEQRFRSGRRLVPVSHEVAFDFYGPSLSAVLIAGLLEKGRDVTSVAQQLATDICSYVRGKNGEKEGTLSQGNKDILAALENFSSTGVCGSKQKSTIKDSIRIAEARNALVLTGNPEEDWMAIRKILSASAIKTILSIEKDAGYLRLLHKGATLRSLLGETWRKNGSYVKARILVQNALRQEHFSASTKKWKGVQVMTIHKSKGKEFTEVIIYEGLHGDRIVWHGCSEDELAQKRLVLRVGVTRGIKNVKIFTPATNHCVLLPPRP